MATAKVDVIDLIDRHPVTGFQIGVLILCMLVAALDGFDTQAIGYTAPAIAGVRFLLARNIRLDEVRRTLEKIMPGAIPPGAELMTTPDPARSGVPVTHLFTEGRALPTVLLWVPFFMVFMVLVTVTFWTPAVLNSVGFSLSAAALIVGLNNFGSVCASALSGWAVHRFGAFKILVPGFIIGGLCLAWFGQATTSVVMLSIASLLAGFFVGGTGTGLIAVAAGMYPTAIRSTGIGWGMGMGRVGQFFGPILTGILVGLGYKVGGIFYAAAVPCFIGALFLLLLKLSRPKMEADAPAVVAPAE